MKRLHPGDSGSISVGNTCVSESCSDPRTSSPVKRHCLGDIAKMSKQAWLWQNYAEDQEEEEIGDYMPVSTWPVRHVIIKEYGAASITARIYYETGVEKYEDGTCLGTRNLRTKTN